MKKAGLGQGRFEMYQPWLRIRRSFSSPISKQVFCNLTLRKSNHHLLSGIEYKTGLLNAWIGPEELRECLPMWPEDHRHPQCGLDHPDESKLAKTQGLLDIAKEAGIPWATAPKSLVRKTRDLPTCSSSCEYCREVFRL